MAQSWRDWIHSLDTFSPQIEYDKQTGKALRDFEKNFLSEDTSVWLLDADASSQLVQPRRVKYAELAEKLQVQGEEEETGDTEDRRGRDASFRFIFVDRQLHDGPARTVQSKEDNRLKLSRETLRLVASRFRISPSFLFSLSRYYLPRGRDFRSLGANGGGTSWSHWYFLPFRVQVKCSDRDGEHLYGSGGPNEIDPFNYLHLPAQDVDIHGSHIALYVCHDAQRNETAAVCFNFMLGGRWHKIVEEPRRRIADVFKHRDRPPSDALFVHLVLMSTVNRWWTNALFSLGEQLTAYQKFLYYDVVSTSKVNKVNKEMSKALHAIAAHVHRYRAEMDSLQETASQVAQVFERHFGFDQDALSDLNLIMSQLRAINQLVQELEKKTENILALLLSNMQLWSDSMMCNIMMDTKKEAKVTQKLAERSQELSEAMKKDSLSMKTITVLTMLFLPGTSFAALLAMPFFADNDYLKDARQVWVWVAITVPTTFAAFVFYYWRKYEADKDNPDPDPDSESTSESHLAPNLEQKESSQKDPELGLPSYTGEIRQHTDI